LILAQPPSLFACGFHPQPGWRYDQDYNFGASRQRLNFYRGTEWRRLQFRTLVRNLHYDFVPQFADLRIQIFQGSLGGFELDSFFLALTEQRRSLLVFFLAFLKESSRFLVRELNLPDAILDLLEFG
jgi:hypothetical protein